MRGKEQNQNLKKNNGLLRASEASETFIQTHGIIVLKTIINL